MSRLWFIFLLLSSCPAGRAETSSSITMDIRAGISEGKIYKDKAARSGFCAAADVSKPEGALLAAASPRLLPGAYLAKTRLKISQTNHLNSAYVEAALSVHPRRKDSPLASRPITILSFEEPQVYQLFELTFSVLQPGSVEVRVSWQRTGKEGKLMRVSSADAPSQVVTPGQSLGDGEKEEGEEDAEADLEEEPDIRVAKHLYLAAADLEIVPLGEIEVRRLEVDRIRYCRQSPIHITCELVNYGAKPRRITLRTELLHDLEPPRRVDERECALPEGRAERVEIDAKLAEELWGCEVRVTALENGELLATRSEYFTVADNMWDVALCGRGWHESRSWDRPRAAALMKTNQDSYANWCESGFWAPDEFGNFTPDTDWFSGGQGCYQGSVSGTRVCIEEGHKRGVSFAVYSNFWGGDGLDGFEMIRKRPEWGYPSTFNVQWLDRWIENIAIPDPGRMRVWPVTVVNMGIEEPFRHHAREFIEAHKTIGFDATRYDSWGSGEGTERLLPLVKKWVNDEVPDYQWGYNCLIPNEAKQWPKGFAEMCRNGGFIMEEGIRSYHKTNETWDRFATLILDYKEEVRERDGNLVIVWLDWAFLNDRLYQSIFTFAGQAHDYGNRIDVTTGNYHQFVTRFAGLIWDRRMSKVREPSKGIEIGPGKEFLWKWQRYVYRRYLGGDRWQFILHLINAPVSPRIYKEDDNAVPPPRKNLELAIRLSERIPVESVYLATAEPELTLTKLEFSRADGRVRVVIPKLRFWSMVVVDLRNAGPM